MASPGMEEEKILENDDPPFVVQGGGGRQNEVGKGSRPADRKVPSENLGPSNGTFVETSPNGGGGAQSVSGTEHGGVRTQKRSWWKALLGGPPTVTPRTEKSTAGPTIGGKDSPERTGKSLGAGKQATVRAKLAPDQGPGRQPSAGQPTQSNGSSTALAPSEVSTQALKESDKDKGKEPFAKAVEKKVARQEQDAKSAVPSEAPVMREMDRAMERKNRVTLPERLNPGPIDGDEQAVGSASGPKSTSIEELFESLQSLGFEVEPLSPSREGKKTEEI